MKVDRREFCQKVAADIFGVAVGVETFLMLSACNGSSPTAPSTPPAQPNPTPVPPQPSNPQQTCWGIRIGEERFAGSPGTLRKVIEAAKIPYQDKPTLEGSQVVSFAGVTPAAGIIFLINGRYFTGSIDNVTLNTRDSWAAYQFTGKHKTGTDANGADVCK